ncbi:GNAT family N-acetyltransferase [Streptomyces sp. NPDC051582]|uniref:GNAT family N-acetyltransferase n=1 Tax=Streptomyces sp. NPDC051582 TaxID=3155167 RepID=UPI00343B8EDC
MTSSSASASAASAASGGSRQPVYSQRVEGLGTVTLTPVDPVADAPLIHSWVTEERARFWGMGEASRELVQEIYEDVDRRTTHHAFLARRDGEPAGLFQTYDCAEDRISECYEVLPGDTGVHLLIGPARGASERGFSAGLIGAFLSYVLSQGSTRRIVAEPDARNEKAMTRLVRSGFELGPQIELPEIDLPEVYLPAKRARLAFLSGPQGG